MLAVLFLIVVATAKLLRHKSGDDAEADIPIQERPFEDDRELVPG